MQSYCFFQIEVMPVISSFLMAHLVTLFQRICITAFCNNLYMLEILHFCNKNSLCCGYTGPTDPTL